ncbi:hypothetical protein I7I48_04316 [Histoplasma ohiense]|nr:hypothetical protein I7I48_04316 [Histoplasma ohiense (nom. inval.)]
MDLVPRSNATLSPHFCSTPGQSIVANISPYPTLPQSCEQTEIVPEHSSIAIGLGIFGSPQMSMCSSRQSILQHSQGWQRGCQPNSAFSPIGVMSGLPSFEEGHLMLQDTAQHHSDASMVYSNPTHCGMASNAMFQRYVPQYNGGFHYPAVPTMRQEHHSIIMQQRQRQVNCSGPRDLEQNTSAHLFELENNAENQSVENNNMQRPAINNKTPRAPLRSSRSHATVSQVDQARSQPFGVRKQSRRRAGGTDTKFECEKCGMRFTRNSNCKSHMKTHDPNRKLPFKCTSPGCTKKFGRKTDLTRHEDSVHKKLRQYGCDQCGHRFARQDTLRRHCEDGCRRRNRQAQRTAKSVPTMPQQAPAYQSPSIPYPDQTSTYPEAEDPQKLNASFLSPYLDDTTNAFHQYL